LIKASARCAKEKIRTIESNNFTEFNAFDTTVMLPRHRNSILFTPNFQNLSTLTQRERGMPQKSKVFYAYIKSLAVVDYRVRFEAVSQATTVTVTRPQAGRSMELN